MTGIERLRKLTDATLGHVRVASVTHYYEDENDVDWDERMHLSELLASIYSQINREQDAMVADSPYEALPPEERETIAWVREHGGLDHVKAEWSSRVPHDLYERRRQRLLGHIAECEAALGRRNVRIEELGKTIEFFQLNNSNFRHLLADVAERLGFTRYGDDYEPDDLIDSLDRRLVPEGCEWPRYDTGEPVRIGDAVADELGHAHEVESVEIFDDAEALHWNPSEPEEFVWLVHGAPVRRPAKPEPTDSWERVEEDARLKPLGYVDRVLGWDMRKSHSENQARSAMTHDLVRRCKALAERERSE